MRADDETKSLVANDEFEVAIGVDFDLFQSCLCLRGNFGRLDTISAKESRRVRGWWHRKNKTRGTRLLFRDWRRSLGGNEINLRPLETVAWKDCGKERRYWKGMEDVEEIVNAATK